MTARPSSAAVEAAPPSAGLWPLEGVAARTLIYVPKTYRPDRPAPVAIILHGAGGHARGMVMPFLPVAEAEGLLLVAPDSHGSTWDVIQGGFGPDVVSMDAALKSLFARCRVDPRRLAICGFSDGASYALSIGTTNGDLFSHVIAFSPGFVAPMAHPDSPRIYVTHGVEDDVLPINPCSRKLVPALRRAGYDVIYREFDGGHEIPPKLIGEAFTWLVGSEAAGSDRAG